MAEKGGNGFSLGKGAVPLRGKDDDSTKSKKGRKVQFNDEESPANFSSKSGEKGAPLKGGKGSARKEPAKYELNVQSELPQNSQCVMDCEAADILQGIQEQMVFLSRDPTIKIPVSFDKGLLYAKTGGRYSNPKTVRQALEGLKKYGVSDAEICVIANSCPENAEEAFALVPSLKAKKNKIHEPLEEIISQLVASKLPTENHEE
ncbi:hypothetical protein SOVF_184950 [Spinacia oleracea]|uniref:DNA-directed RNA polymerases IV and V subunit 4 isoform X2 n=1 Tax=Spinacia oleracea TaxID=3562 RepID=A0A9R0IAR0_SPIOL|nr:DNA-directed RNA polymerases IV and V subunit 4-like isoform X2 [Spinacia oleracea]KNA06019.1 hypothetical protein SOVF_184950 [Spinacia oleracea]